jgi:hypothetical protein
VSIGSGKRRRSEVYRFEIEDPAAARASFRNAQLSARQDPTEEKQRAVDEARQALRACYGTVTVQAIPPADWAAFRQEVAELAAAYAKDVRDAESDGPPPAPPQSSWLADTVEVRILAACDADGEHTAAWWAAEFEGAAWSEDERQDLLDLCFVANSPAQIDLAVLGKD